MWVARELRNWRDVGARLAAWQPRCAQFPEIQVSSFCGKRMSLSPVGALWMNALLP
jgi:hypothetical protein